ncbi:MAG TPA: hypothetical protein VHE12_04775 [bacterium]|nr:hypothetical protein [bacterium]
MTPQKQWWDVWTSLVLPVFFLNFLLFAGYSKADMEFIKSKTFKVKVYLKNGKQFECYLGGEEKFEKYSGSQLLKFLRANHMAYFFENEDELKFYSHVQKVKYPFNFYATMENKKTKIKVAEIIKIENLGFISDGLISNGLSQKVISFLNKKPNYILGGKASNYQCGDGHGDDATGYGSEFLVYDFKGKKDSAQKLCNDYEEEVFVKHFDKNCRFIKGDKMESWAQLVNFEDEELLNKGIVVLHIPDSPGKKAFGDVRYMNDY